MTASPENKRQSLLKPKTWNESISLREQNEQTMNKYSFPMNLSPVSQQDPHSSVIHPLPVVFILHCPRRCTAIFHAPSSEPINTQHPAKQAAAHFNFSTTRLAALVKLFHCFITSSVTRHNPSLNLRTSSCSFQLQELSPLYPFKWKINMKALAPM